MTTVTETPSIPLREVRGPAAFGGEAKRFFQLLWLISKTELRTRYQGAAFGMAWAVAEPLLIFGVMYAVFSSVARFGGIEPHYAPMLLMNIMLYRAIFAGSTARATQAVVAREGLVRKTQFPRIIIPLSVVLTSMLLFGADVIVLIVFLLINGIQPMWTWLLVPVIVLSVLILTIGMSLLLSSLYVRHRDTAPVWSVISLMFFYGSPVIFPVNAVPSSLRGILFFMNPFVPMLEQARIWMINPAAPPITSIPGVHGPVHGLLIPALVYVGVCVLGAWYFIKRAPRVAEEI
jgi:ABC-2 type transport system permease protein